MINQKRGATNLVNKNDPNSKPIAPPAKNIFNSYSESGQKRIIADNAAGLTTYKQYTPDDYCESCFFTANDGRVYQANFTEYDSLQRIAKVRDTRIVIEYGYDANNKRRYAKAFVLGDNNEKWCFRESWFDYTDAGRVRVRDGVMTKSGITIVNKQGLKFDYEKGLTKLITQIIDNQPQYKKLDYDVLGLLNHLRIGSTPDLRNPKIDQTHVRDDARRTTEVATRSYCVVKFMTQQPSPATRYEIPTFIVTRKGQEWQLFLYTANSSTEISIKDNPSLKSHFKNDVDDLSIDKCIKDFYARNYGNFTRCTTTYCPDDKIKKQVTEQIKKDGNILKTERVIDQYSGNIPLTETLTTHGVLRDKKSDVKGDFTLVEKLKNTIVYAFKKSIGSAWIVDSKVTEAHQVKEENITKTADVQSGRNSNDGVTFVTGNISSTQSNEPTSYREFILNTDSQVVMKQTANGRDYYFYAETRPGQPTLLAYFGDLPEALRMQLKHKAPKLTANLTQSPPSVMNIDLLDQTSTQDYPPQAPSDFTPPVEMSFEQIADSLQYTGYAAAIAAYNNRDVNSTVSARETIKIPPLYVVAPPTAWNGSVPNVETVLGSLYPSLPLPAITLKPKERDWLEIYLEATIATAIMICAPELIAQALGLVLTTVTGAMVTGAIAGAMASTVDQLIAMGYHSQASFKLKDVAINAMMTGITGGLNKLAQGGEAFAVASLGVKAGALAHGVVTAEAIALAQQAALVATHLQKHMDWHAVSSAVFNAVMDDTAKNLIGGEGDFAKLARSGMTRFADALGAAVIYKQKMTFSGMTAQVLGGMTGSVMGSQMMDAEVRKHEAAMRVERGMEVGFAGGGRSVAQLGMSVDEDRDRPSPKPSYAKVDMDRDIAEAKVEHEASSLAEVLRASRMDRWREDVGAIGSQVGQFFNENGPSISQGLRYFSLLNDLLSLSSQSSSKYSSARTHVTSFSLPNTKFDYWKSVNDGFWGTIGTINVFGDMIGYPLHHPIDTVTGIKNLFGLGRDTTKVLMGTDLGGASRQNLINAKDAFVLGMNKLSEDTLSNDTYRSHYALGSGLFSIALMFGGELGLAGRLSRVTIEGGERAILNEGLHHLNPKDLKFTQPNVGTHFSNGKSLSETINELRTGATSVHDFPPIQVVQIDGQLFTIDNRRLLAFNGAGVEKIPVEIVSLENPLVATKFGRRFNPIAGQGNYAVVVNRAGREDALELLEKFNLIKSRNYGY